MESPEGTRKPLNIVVATEMNPSANRRETDKPYSFLLMWLSNDILPVIS